MSAFTQAAADAGENVRGIFGIAATDPGLVKSGVVLGISALDGQSFGNDRGFDRHFNL